MVDIKQRAIIVSKRTETIEETVGQNKANRTIDRTIVCAEPSPDSMAAYAAEVAGKANAFAKVDAEFTGAFQEAAAYVGLRTPSIQLMRDGLYRLCEGYMNGALDKETYETLMRRYQRYMVALLGIEQLTEPVRVPPIVIHTEGRAEIAASISKMRKEAEEIESEIRNRENEVKDDIDVKLTKSTTNAHEKKMLQERKTRLEKESTTRKKDLEQINKAIERARESVVSGSARAVVNIPANQGGGADIGEMAKEVQTIVSNILGTDDGGQLCWEYLTTTKDLNAKLGQACMNRIAGDSSNSNNDNSVKVQDLNMKLDEIKITMTDVRTYLKIA